MGTSFCAARGTERGSRFFVGGKQSIQAASAECREIGTCPQGGQPSRGRQCRQPSRDERGVLSFHLWVPLGIAAWYGKLEFARRAGGQVVAGSAGSQAVTNVVCCRFTFGYRSVSFYGSINWNLIDN